MRTLKEILICSIEDDGLYPVFEDLISALKSHIDEKDNEYDNFNETNEYKNLEHSLELLTVIGCGLDKDYHIYDAETRFNLTKEIMGELCKINVNGEL